MTLFLQEFIGQMARLIKKLDKNHLVTFDSEGFFGPSTAGTMGCMYPYVQAYIEVNASTFLVFVQTLLIE